jgi:hypothetical protein
MPGSENPRAIFTKYSIWIDIAIKCRPSNPELGTELAHPGFFFPHSGLSETDLCFCQTEFSSSCTAASPGGFKTSLCALAYELSFKFSQGGEYAEYEFSARRGRINIGAFPGKHFESDTPFRKIVDRIDQVAQITAEPVELPDHKGITLPERLHTCVKARSLIPFSGRLIFIDMLWRNAGTDKGISLQVNNLGAIGFGNADISYQHMCFTNLRL